MDGGLILNMRCAGRPYGLDGAESPVSVASPRNHAAAAELAEAKSQLESADRFEEAAMVRDEKASEVLGGLIQARKDLEDMKAIAEKALDPVYMAELSKIGILKDLAKLQKKTEAERDAAIRERDEVYQKLDDDRKFLQDRAHDYCVRMEKAKAQLAASLAREEEKDRALKAVQWSCDNGEDEVCCPECGAFRYERKHRPTCIIGAITPPTKSPEKEAGL